MKADLTTKNTQKLENLEDLLKYKNFLEKITPPDFLSDLEKRKANRKRHIQQKKIYNYNMPISKEIQEILEDSDDEFNMFFSTPN